MMRTDVWLPNREGTERRRTDPGRRNQANSESRMFLRLVHLTLLGLTWTTGLCSSPLNCQSCSVWISYLRFNCVKCSKGRKLRHVASSGFWGWGWMRTKWHKRGNNMLKCSRRNRFEILDKMRQIKILVRMFVTWNFTCNPLKLNCIYYIVVWFTVYHLLVVSVSGLPCAQMFPSQPPPSTGESVRDQIHMKDNKRTKKHR